MSYWSAHLIKLGRNGDPRLASMVAAFSGLILE